jgi:hypothetical protein
MQQTKINNISVFPQNIDNTNFLDTLEEKFKLINMKLKKLRNFFDETNTLLSKKNQKQEKLEQLKNAYSTMKKIYENALKTKTIRSDC